jgi:hypothetical protein
MHRWATPFVSLLLFPTLTLAGEVQTLPVKEVPELNEPGLVLETVSVPLIAPVELPRTDLDGFHEAVIADIQAATAEEDAPPASSLGALAREVVSALSVLDLTYAATLETVSESPSALSKIKKSQKLWEAYVEPNCEAEVALVDAREAGTQCLLREIDARTDWLRTLSP